MAENRSEIFNSHGGDHYRSGGTWGAGRWQDWFAVVVGALTALSPLWLDTSMRVNATLVVLGVVIAVAGLYSLARPGSTNSEYAHVGLGVVLFLAPWVMRYTAFSGASWMSWIAGALTVMAGLGALPSATTAHRVLGQH